MGDVLALPSKQLLPLSSYLETTKCRKIRSLRKQETSSLQITPGGNCTPGKSFRSLELIQTCTKLRTVRRMGSGQSELVKINSSRKRVKKDFESLSTPILFNPNTLDKIDSCS